MNVQKFLSLIKAFFVPILVFAGLIAFLILLFLHLTTAAVIIALLIIVIGSYELFRESFDSLLQRQFGIDYIAILAILVSIITKEYLVGIVIALMSSTGRKLEDYGASQARKSLSLLADRIPHDVMIEKGEKPMTIPVGKVEIGQTVVVRKGEVIPLDGILLSDKSLVDESSLTGEPYSVDKVSGDQIRSGTINVGDIMKVRVTREEKNSTYKKIIAMVEKAENEKAPMVRLADKYSVYFTIITFVIAAAAFFLNHSLEAILSVLVVATPCPLILATPIALLGGVNAAAKKRIIVKKLASIEALSRTNTVVFDKTGTITLGKPTVTKFEIKDKTQNREKLLGISQAIERNSLHPLAKAVLNYTAEQKAPVVHVGNVTEILGKGISGTVSGKTYILSKLSDGNTADMIIGLFEEKKLLGTFSFEDEIKEDSREIIRHLSNMGLSLSIFTGDKKEVAKLVAKRLGIDVEIKAELRPEDKQKGIEELKNKGKTIAMIGDGINDAPALALSDVGMVFSNEEQTAASEAADIVFLGGNFSLVLEALKGAKRTIGIAQQSIFWGIGLSIGFMVAAALGFVPPVAGAVIQEGIDVAVILNALRASR